MHHRNLPGLFTATMLLIHGVGFKIMLLLTISCIFFSIFFSAELVLFAGHAVRWVFQV